MKDPLFSGKRDDPEDRDYFTTENETDGEAVSPSSVLTINIPLPTEAQDGKEDY